MMANNRTMLEMDILGQVESGQVYTDGLGERYLIIGSVIFQEGATKVMKYFGANLKSGVCIERAECPVFFFGQGHIAGNNCMPMDSMYLKKSPIDERAA